jgi:predicted PurR-regulated permease PerM
MSTIDPNRIKQVFFIIILTAFGILLFVQMNTFLPAILGAITLYMLMRKSMHRLVYKRKWKKDFAAGILMFTSFLVVLVPIWALVSVLSAKVGYAMEHSEELLNSLKALGHKLELKFHVSILSEANIAKLSNMTTNAIPNILGATFNTVTSIAIMYFILYFMLANSVEMEDNLYEYIPLKDENVGWIGSELDNLVYANAIGVPLIALLQGIVALIGYLIIGVPDVMFWFIITAIASMLPFIGAAAGYVPLAIFLFVQGDNSKAVYILLYGFIIIGLVDNVFRIFLGRKLGDVHPLITVFGVIIGVNMFGFIGLIFGPILIALFLLLMKIYTNEFGAKRVRTKVKE